MPKNILATGGLETKVVADAVPDEVLEICKIMAGDTLLGRKPPYFLIAHPSSGLEVVTHKYFNTGFGGVFLTVHPALVQEGEIRGVSESLYRYLLIWKGLR